MSTQHTHHDTESVHLMNTYARQDVMFTHGQGVYLWDRENNDYLDAIAGIAVTSLGHAHPEITHAIHQQAQQLLHTSNLFRIEWQEALGQRLHQLTGMESSFICNSGAEANEAALKLAKLHGHNKGFSEPLIIVMENSFHGRTLATLAATGNAAIQRGFEPLYPGFIRVPFNDIESVAQALNSNDQVAAVLLEPVQGESGVRPAHSTYLKQLESLCKQHDVLLMIDEVQTGLGRTGKWFGFQHADIKPDVITLAKALGNGVPIGACLAQGHAATLFSPGSHGTTFGGNPLACRVACTVLDIMQRDHLIDHTQRMGDLLFKQLTEALIDIDHIESIRGMGLMIGIETKIPCGHLVTQALHDERLLITVSRNHIIRLLPPLIINEEQLLDLVARLKRLLSTLA